MTGFRPLKGHSWFTCHSTGWAGKRHHSLWVILSYFRKWWYKGWMMDSARFQVLYLPMLITCPSFGFFIFMFVLGTHTSISKNTYQVNSKLRRNTNYPSQLMFNMEKHTNYNTNDSTIRKTNIAMNTNNHRILQINFLVDQVVFSIALPCSTSICILV